MAKIPLNLGPFCQKKGYRKFISVILLLILLTDGLQALLSAGIKEMVAFESVRLPQ